MKLFKRRQNNSSINISFSRDAINYLMAETQDGYDGLKKYISHWYSKKHGENALYDRLTTITRQGNVSNPFEAVNEFVAENFDTVIYDKSILSDIKKNERNLYSNLESWVKDLIKRMQTGMDSIAGSKDNEQGADLMKKEIKKLADMFNINIG